jgi:hypothetical protein
VTVTGGTLEPGETDQMTLTIKNVGELALTNVSATLSSTDPQVTIVDNLGNFGNINPNQQATNASNTFSVAADQYATVGRMVDYILHLSSANGCEQDITFDFAIGAISSDDPIGPDSYGYYCLDNTDVEYSGHPDYNWVEVVSTGTHIYLPDWGNEQDCSARINLPFNFQFYGESFDALTVCSNGWLAFGDQTYFVDFRNYCIPSAGGAGNGMLCPLWDNLVMGSGGVYYYYDATNHRFIVEYSHTPVQYGGDECFEVILYDPAYYPTPTGDGEIAFQYMVFNAVYGTGSDNPYCTVGIENHEHSDGIQYSYWNAYAPGAATLGWYKALKFTTIEPIRSPQAAVIDVTITPINPPINIPATGGSFQYTANVTNTGTQTTVFDFWINVTEPNGQTIGPFQYKPNLEFDPGQTVQRTMTQYVPGRAPAGVYTYTAKVGDYTASVVWDSSYFNFTKLGADGTGGGEWTLSGWDEGSTSTNIDLPETYVLSEATPNPFNPVTEISYALPQAGRVTLTVFNSRGQQVAVLQDGWSEAGWHKVVFDATALSSGLYLYNIKANDFTQTRKMLLVK